MADEVQPVDWWGVLEEAEETVEQWPEWQRQYEVDVNTDTVIATRTEPHAS
jgi:hypothetical protein